MYDYCVDWDEKFITYSANLLQSKMRHSKNNSSILDTTTLLSMSNVSHESSFSAPSAQTLHDTLIQKVHELELILHTTLAEGTLLNKKQKELILTVNERKAALERMNTVRQEVEEDESQDECAQTQRVNFVWGSNQEQSNFARTAKQYQKIYSAIQSPSVNHSPQKNFDHFTLLSHQKSNFGPQSTTVSAKSGIIRKQCDHSRLRKTPSYLSPRQRDYESIEDIWNGVDCSQDNRRQQNKPLGHKSIKSFL